jgi:dCTP deaminase
VAILTGPEIIRQIAQGHIVITPFNPQAVNPNSVNLTLAPELKVYVNCVLDARYKAETRTITMPEEGFVFHPGVLYLASTIEWTETHRHVPRLDGRSSLARLGVRVHQTAGFGDIGYAGKFTCEIEVVHPVKLYPGMQVCQISYETVEGEIMPYKGRYQGSTEAVASKLWEG